MDIIHTFISLGVEARGGKQAKTLDEDDGCTSDGDSYFFLLCTSVRTKREKTTEQQ